MTESIETQALVAVLDKDWVGLKAILREMLPEELVTLARTCERLADEASEELVTLERLADEAEEVARAALETEER